MRKMGIEEMSQVNGGEFFTLMGIWALVCVGFIGAMKKLAEYGLSSVKRKK